MEKGVGGLWNLNRYRPGARRSETRTKLIIVIVPTMRERRESSVGSGT
jgi:hypothetical protein